jgi:hypothetical protein
MIIKNNNKIFMTHYKSIFFLERYYFLAIFAKTRSLTRAILRVE